LYSSVPFYCFQGESCEITSVIQRRAVASGGRRQKGQKGEEGEKRQKKKMNAQTPGQVNLHVQRIRVFCADASLGI